MTDNRLAGYPHPSKECLGYTIRFAPSLNLAALQAHPRHTKPLILWYCMRAIDRAGRGVLDQRDVVQILCLHFGYKRQTVYKHLKTGSAVYWRLHRSRKGKAIIILRGLLCVARCLGADIGKRECFVEMPATDLPHSSQSQARRALIYNAGAYEPRSVCVNHPISRMSLEEKTGIGSRQQRRYDRISESHGVIREATFGSYRDPESLKLRGLVRVVQTDWGWFRTAQLPNRYRTWCVRGSRGMLSRVARILSPSNQSSSRGEATFGRNQRRYYRDFQTFLRAASRGEAIQGYYPSRCDDRKYISGIIC